MAFLLTLFGGFFLIMASVSSATHRLNTRKYERMKFLATTVSRDGNWDLKTDYLKFTPAQFPVRLFQDLENKVLNISF